MSENKDFLKAKKRLKCCRECGDDDCTAPCDQAVYRIERIRLNRKFKALNYPGQDRYGMGNNLLIHLKNNKRIYINRQAREVLDFHKVDETKFVQAMTDLLEKTCDSLHTDDRGVTYSARGINVTTALYDIDKTTNPDDYADSPHIRIDLHDFSGMLKNGADAHRY